jgi:hypothetical protein
VTTTAVSLAKPSVKHGQPDTVTVHVGGHAGGGYPTGTVTAKVTVRGKTTTQTVTLRAAAKATVAFSVRAPSSAGTGTVTVTYSADRNFLGSSASHAIKVRCRIVCDNPRDTPSRRAGAHERAGGTFAGDAVRDRPPGGADQHLIAARRAAGSCATTGATRRRSSGAAQARCRLARERVRPAAGWKLPQSPIQLPTL